MSGVMQHRRTENAGIEFTPAATEHVLAYLKQQHRKGIRLSVKKTGCSGLSYVIDYIDKPDGQDIIFPLPEDYLVCIEKVSYPFLKGLKLDYVKEGLNYKFVFTNPNQTGQCGCGESFTVG